MFKSKINVFYFYVNLWLLYKANKRDGSLDKAAKTEPRVPVGQGFYLKVIHVGLNLAAETLSYDKSLAPNF